MLESLRKHNKILMAVLVLLIVPSFVLVGVNSYINMGQKDRVVAHVGSAEITQSEWDAAHRAEVERLRQIMPSIDAKLLDSDAARQGVLERLVRERVIQQAAQDERLSVSDGRLYAELQRIPAIAQLPRTADGRFNIEAYSDLLARQGLTPAGFEAQVRAELAMQQVQAGVTGTALMAATPADLALNAWLERREIQVAQFKPADYAAQVQPTEAELQAFWQANQGLFQAKEQARVEYVVLDIDAVRKDIRISEADLKSYYEQNVDRLSGPEERRASHILIAVDSSASASDRQKAKEHAEALLAQLRKAPANQQAKLFADLARKDSQDPGSAAKGGDLDWFGRGAMVPPFENAAFALKQGDISDVVESDFGYHIITVTGIKKPKQKSFAELRPQLEEQLKTQQARAKYAEAAEAFTNGVYEQADSLKPVADPLHLAIQTATVERQGTTQGLLNNAKLLAAIFSDDAIRNKRNTEAVEVAPSKLVSARIVQYDPARTLPLAEVHEAAKARVTQARAAELARADGEAKLAAWKATPAQAKLAAAQTVSRDQTQNLPRALLDAVLRADIDKNPWVGVNLGEQGYIVARVNKRIERPAVDANAQQQQRGQYMQWWTQAESDAWYQLLKARLETRIDAPGNSKS